MESIADILNAVDSPWNLVALMLLGFFAFAWKYGKEFFALLHETRDAAKGVEKSIVTNHGSKNIGDAIDRLTGWYMTHQLEAEERQRLLGLIVEKLDNHIADCAPLSELVQEINTERERTRR